jgi:hypothetical protein
VAPAADRSEVDVHAETAGPVLRQNLVRLG